jgi:DNA polymerase subunit Cdc27
VIQNPEVRRRKGKRPIIPDAPPLKFKAIKDEPKPTSATSRSSNIFAAKQEEPRPGSSGSTSAITTSSAKQPALKRDASDFFKKSFGKLKPKAELERKGTDVSTNASASGTEDAKLTDADEEGESEDDAIFLDTGTKKAGTKKRASDVKKEREDKAAKLRRMMDSDDEDSVPNVADGSGTNADPVTKMTGDAGGEEGEDADVAWSDSDTEKKRLTIPSKDNSTSQKDVAGDSQASASVNEEPKRRRGRRKVIRKKTTKDEEGYLVTREEAVWESFSEEEPEPAKSSLKSSVPAGAGRGLISSQSQQLKSSTGGGKGGKGGAAKGGGSIMSFFGKK